MKAWLREVWGFVITAFALGALVGVYQETHGFHADVPWYDWLVLAFAATTLVAATENLIARGVAKGIAKAKAAEQKALLPPVPLEPIQGEGAWADTKRAYREALTAKQPK